MNMQKSNSIFQKLVLTETFDVIVLDKLLASNLLLSVHKDSSIYENERQQLVEIRKHLKKNQLRVVYNLPAYKYGRVYPFRSLSLCSLRKPIRHSLAKNYYTDIDVTNCHPVILKQLCEQNNIECPCLTEYVTNRDQYLAEIMTTYNVDRSSAKTLFLQLMYYGSFESWADAELVDYKIRKPKFITKFTNELKVIGFDFQSSNPEIVKVVAGLEKTNEMGSVMSIILQEYERRVLECVFTHLKEIKAIKNDAVLCFDGIMIPTVSYKPELLESIHIAVQEKMNLNLEFVTKSMDDDLLDQLPAEQINTNSFEYVSTEFELTHAKIINKALYVKTADQVNLFLSKKTLHDAHEHMIVEEDGKEISFIDKWTTRNSKIRRYDDVGIYPTPLAVPDKMFNLWTPFKAETFTAPFEHDLEGLEFVLNHIRILCNHEVEVFEYLTKWLGQMIQYPAVKTICPTLISKQGAGKGSLIHLLKELLGESKVMETTDPSRDVWGQFNGPMANSFFVVLNELSKSQTVECEGKLKGLVTDRALVINSKGLNQFLIDSYHRFLVTTNKEDPIATSEDDRRNLIIRSSDEKCGDKEYFKKLYFCMADYNVLCTVYEYFKSIPDLDKFNELPIPQTQHQNILKQLDRSIPEQFLIDLINEHYEEIEYTVSSKKLFEMFIDFVTAGNMEYNTTPIKFGVQLSLLKVDGLTKSRVTAGNMNTFNIPKLKKHFKM